MSGARTLVFVVVVAAAAVVVVVVVVVVVAMVVVTVVVAMFMVVVECAVGHTARYLCYMCPLSDSADEIFFAAPPSRAAGCSAQRQTRHEGHARPAYCCESECCDWQGDRGSS